MDLMARRRAIMGMPSGKDYTVSGNVISISNALAKNAKSAIVTFLPKQSGSGDPSPDNVRPISGYNDIGAVRTGKNVFGGEDMADNITTNLSSATKNTTNKTVSFGYNAGSALATVISGGFFKPNTVYTLIFSALNATIARSNMAVVYTDGTSSIMGMTKTNEKETLRFVTNSSKSVSYIGLQRQGGTTVLYYEECGIFVGNVDASAFEPYISPVTANVHVGGAGKNKFNKDGTDTSKGYVAGKYLSDSGGVVTPGSGSFDISEYIPILPNTSYTVSGLPTSNTWSPSICQYDSNHTFISGVGYNNSATKTITTGANAAYVRMSIPTVNINSLQLEVGSSATTYEPYSLFGGTVDLVSGECVVTWGMADMGTLGWQYSTSYNYPYFYTGVPSDNIVTEWNVASIGCSFYKPLVGMTGGSFRNNSRDLCIAPIYGQSTSFRVALQDSSVTSVADLKTKVNGQQLIYQLATPVTYQLTPSQLALLKGNNTVYSNEGSMSLTYVGK